MDNNTQRRIIKPPKKIHLDESLYRVPGYVFFFTIQADLSQRCFTRHDLNMEIIDCLRREKEHLRCQVFVYCLMATHLHFLTSTTTRQVSVLDLVSRFKGKSTRIGWKYDIGKVLWQRRTYDHIVRKSEDLVKIPEYILDNPVRKGLVEQRDEYPYSGCWDRLPV